VDEVLGSHEEVTEPAVARILAGVLTDGSTLVASSSMPVRDVEWFMRPRHGLRVVSNRGVNGIDGVVSTAIGVALHASGPAGRPSSRSPWERKGTTGALLGDLALLHDVGGLLWAVDRGADLTFVVVDNDGGGIFSFLPQATALPEPKFERLWGTPHGLDLERVASAYRIGVDRVSRCDELGPAVESSTVAGGVRMILARTDRRTNVALHDELNAAVAEAVAGLAES
jgi:2-succinyl-5-enolpyruvyl-6-hydroxy-3-cyclohexene-1-carboxylate synthase